MIGYGEVLVPSLPAYSTSPVGRLSKLLSVRTVTRGGRAITVIAALAVLAAVEPSSGLTARMIHYWLVVVEVASRTKARAPATGQYCSPCKSIGKAGAACRVSY